MWFWSRKTRRAFDALLSERDKLIDEVCYLNKHVETLSGEILDMHEELAMKENECYLLEEEIESIEEEKYILMGKISDMEYRQMMNETDNETQRYIIDQYKERIAELENSWQITCDKNEFLYHENERLTDLLNQEKDKNLDLVNRLGELTVENHMLMDQLENNN